MSIIKDSIVKLSKQYRVIFWYDGNDEFSHEFETLEFEDISKIKVENNEFEVKYLVYNNSNQKYLLYFDKHQPNDIDNWLLDIQLFNYTFNTDRYSLILQEIGLDYHFKDWVSNYGEFFKSKLRTEKFKTYLNGKDKENELTSYLLQIVFKTDRDSIEDYIKSYINEYINGTSDTFKNYLIKYNLNDEFWNRIQSEYNYINESDLFLDFVIEVFKRGFSLTSKTTSLSSVKPLFSSFKDSRSFDDEFRKISRELEKTLKIKSVIQRSTIEELINDDLFEIIEKKIISDITSQIVVDKIGVDKIDKLVKRRVNKYWYIDYYDFYQSIKYGVSLIEEINNWNCNFEDFLSDIKQYIEKDYIIDFYYRKFIFHYRETNKNKVFSSLNEKVNKIYNNNYLLNQSEKFQLSIDTLTKYPFNHIQSQRSFFDREIRPFLDKGNKVFVIITDALRYENGVELNELLQREKRYESEVDYQFSSIPSYTQLGMASLLPHKQISLSDKGDHILVDDQSTLGKVNREKVLKINSGVDSVTINGEKLMSINSSTEGRDLVKSNQLFYIYHNRIDKTGDDTTSEDKVFDSVEKELKFLVDLVKRISSMNGNNIIITSDHGYLYQNEILEESDFMDLKVSGDIWKRNRRFVIGENLQADGGVTKFNGKQIGIENDIDFIFPKGINRIKVKGSGSKFVHGGISLQEIVTPVLRVRSRRYDTTRKVDVDIIRNNMKVTSSNHLVLFYQTETISKKILQRKIKSSFKSEDGTILSDVFIHNFDIEEKTSSEREVKHFFQMKPTTTSDYKNQSIYLVLEETIDNSSKWKEYKTFEFSVNILFTSDFDDI